jgi:hypothetical protein
MPEEGNMNRIILLTGFLLFAAGITACHSAQVATVDPAVGLTASAFSAESETAQAAEELTRTVGQQATLNAAATGTADASQKAAQATLDAQATGQAQATATVEASRNAIETANAELKGVFRQTFDANQANLAQTETADVANKNQIIQNLVAKGILTNAEGSFIALDDFNESWAQINWYQYWPTEYSPTNFVITMDAQWDSASKVANWFNSGCGLVFGRKDNDNHTMVYLGLDGRARLENYYKGAFSLIADRYYGKIDIPKGEAKLTLAVIGNHVWFFVNDTEVIDTSVTHLEKGLLAYTLVSGTNKGFGTHCKLSDVSLWVVED